MNKIATVLLFVNFITVLFPQPGYIHPDEFLQSSEVVAGDILGVSHFRAWEFNSSFPVRSIVFPYIVTSPSLYLLRWLNSTKVPSLQLSAVKVVMATRLPIAFLSVLGFLATGRLATAFHTDKYLSCILYCSSYVSWTYYTRTFSNSIESALLAVVLILSLSCSSFSASSETSSSACRRDSEDGKNKPNAEKEKNTQEDKGDQKEGVTLSRSDNQGKSENGENVEKDVKKKEVGDKTYAKNTSESDNMGERDMAEENDDEDEEMEETATLKTAEIAFCSFTDMEQYPVKSLSFVLGIVIVAGFFNRPTFLVFVFMPVMFWLWNVACNCSEQKCWHIFYSLFFSLSGGAFVSFITFVVLDTVYYDPQFLTNLSVFFQSCMKPNFPATMLSKNWKAVVSSLIITPWNFVQYNIDSSNLAQHGLHPRVTHLLVNIPLLLGPLCVPFAIVSVMSIYRLVTRMRNNHTAWLTLMAFVPIMSLSVFPHQEPRFLIPLLPILVVMGSQIIAAMAPAKLSFFTMWTLFNIILTLVYGYMHQAALIPALSIYQQKLSSSLSNSPVRTYHAIFYKTYPPPQHLLLLEPSSTQATITDLAGSPVETLVQTVRDIKSTCGDTRKKCDVFVFLPSVATPRAVDLMSNYKVSVTSICPHFSMESRPRFRAWWGKRIKFDEFIMDFCLNILKIT